MINNVETIIKGLSLFISDLKKDSQGIIESTILNQTYFINFTA